MKLETICGVRVEVAETDADLRAIYGQPSERALQKTLTRLDRHCQDFIARSPFLCLSTADADGAADLSPRGDAPGFVRVLDDQTLLIPDRLGNNRLDSLLNLIKNPHIGLLFLIPGIDETLRVNGVGQVVTRSSWLEELSVGGKTPRSAVVVQVREAFLQCAKALKRSRLWSDDYRVARKDVPTLGQILFDQIGGATPATELDAAIEKSYRERLN